MYYKQAQREELNRAQMDMARKGFRGKLVRLRFSPQFIVNNADELLGIAHSEYVRAIEKGVEVEDPVAWTIHCAWRRTQNLLEAENYRPRMVSSEKVMELVDDEELPPDETALEADRARKIREAVEKLTEDQHKVIALTFFEGLSVREAASYLNWSAGKVQHHRDTALTHLRRLLPVKVSDELLVDFGLAGWLALAATGSAFHLPAGFEGLLDRAGHGASGAWARAHDLARRFSFGGGNDAAGAVASSGVGRAAGVCATGLAIVCFAGATTGIVGPGVGGGLGALGGGGGESPRQEKPARHPQKSRGPATDPVAATARASSSQPSPTTAAATTSTTTPSSTPRKSPSQEESGKSSAVSNAAAAKADTKKTEEDAEATRVEEQVSGIARAGAESSPTPPAAAASGGDSSDPVTVVKVPAAPSRSSGGSGQASGEFGFEK